MIPSAFCQHSVFFTAIQSLYHSVAICYCTWPELFADGVILLHSLSGLTPLEGENGELWTCTWCVLVCKCQIPNDIDCAPFRPFP
jgi:hypothetical protein